MDYVDSNRAQGVLEMVFDTLWLPHYAIRLERGRMGWHAVLATVQRIASNVLDLRRAGRQILRLQRHQLTTQAVD